MSPFCLTFKLISRYSSSSSSINNSQEFIEFVEAEQVVEQEPVQTGLPPVEADYVEEDLTGEWYTYTRISLKELEDGDEYEGKPILLPNREIIFEDEEQPKYRAELILVDDESEEYLQININLKTKDEIQSNVHNASSLYALIGGIQNLSNPQWTKRFNRIRKVNLEEWREYIETKESMTIEVVEKSGSNFTYNSFRITDLS